MQVGQEATFRMLKLLRIYDVLVGGKSHADLYV